MSSPFQFYFIEFIIRNGVVDVGATVDNAFFDLSSTLS